MSCDPLADGQTEACVPRPPGSGREKRVRISYGCDPRGIPLARIRTAISTRPLNEPGRTSRITPGGHGSRAFRKSFRKTCCSCWRLSRGTEGIPPGEMLPDLGLGEVLCGWETAKVFLPPPMLTPHRPAHSAPRLRETSGVVNDFRLRGIVCFTLFAHNGLRGRLRASAWQAFGLSLNSPERRVTSVPRRRPAGQGRSVYRSADIGPFHPSRCGHVVK